MSFALISVAELKAALHDGEELALLDAREEVPFDKRHLLMASCLPLGRIELLASELLPREDVRVVWCDGGEGLAERAATRLLELGYSNVSVLDGGVPAWEDAGHSVYSGVHVPSKAFAEVVEHEAQTPWIDAAELKGMMDAKADMVILDTRSYEEYHVNSIPGAISVPGAEIVYRINDIAPSEHTTVVVNCGGRTRSIIGAQALINAQIPNKVVSLKNGTQDWHLYGYEVIKGATRVAPEVSSEGLKRAREGAANVAELCDVRALGKDEFLQWRHESSHRTTYFLDVRTHDEYFEGHVPGTKHIAGGQLIQETDRHLAVWGARVVLFDNDGVRATLTASWLKQMGWDVVTVTCDVAGGATEQGMYRAIVQGLDSSRVKHITPAGLKQKLEDGEAVVIDLNWSKSYYEGHIPQAWYAIRSRLDEDLSNVPEKKHLVFTSPNGVLAAVAAADRAAQDDSILALEGGTAAWRTAGYPLNTGAENMASLAEDIRLKAREEQSDIEAAMRAYLAWEIQLLHDMARDDDHRFQVVAPGG